MKGRYLTQAIQTDALASRKMAFISGPRQVGKTTLSKGLLKVPSQYHTWDDVGFRRRWIENPLSAAGAWTQGPIVFDELHKYRKWKTTLKGVYDQIGQDIPIVVTGSGRLDLYQKGGDSLMGRYLPYRLHPFSVSESESPPSPDELSPQTVSLPFKDLMLLTGFPEPCLSGNRNKALRWSRLRKERLVYEDVRDLKNIQSLSKLEILLHLLPERIGSTLSLNAMHEDLDVAYSTLREWYIVLKSLFVFFEVGPYSRNIKRSLKKEKKIYLYDCLDIPSEGALIENLVALHLKKSCDFWTDTAQGLFELHYIRNREKEEVDFCITRDRKPWMLVECNGQTTHMSPALIKFRDQLKPTHCFQLTTQAKVDQRDLSTGIRRMSVDAFCSMFV